jgi:hypothetical protein
MLSEIDDDAITTRVLPRFPIAAGARVARFGGGLINQTFEVTEPDGCRFVLQRVNPLFPKAIHENIRAVTAALARAGLTTPALVETVDGDPCLELPPNDRAADRGDDGDDGDDKKHSAPGAATPYDGRPSVWRLMTYVDGVSFDVVSGPTQARAAGALIARFHNAVDGVDHTFVGLRGGVHDTPKHLETLRRAVAAHPSHRLHADVAPLAAQIADAATRLPALPTLPPRICHGDLKFNNVLFAGTTPPAARDTAVCLVDLDTVGPLALAFEWGDAWRSWCNRAGEDDPIARLDLAIFEASLDGYLTGLAEARRASGGTLDLPQRQALLLGPEWISLELAARFGADALAESYFGWDPLRYPGRGEHNLVRARGQFSLHQAFVATRAARARLLA